MGNVKVTPQGGGTPFEFNMLPDTGCTQSLVAEDVVSRYGLAVNWRGKKKIRAVNNQKLDCSGTVTLHLEFDGHSTEVVALVSSSIKSKVLLCWRTLQKLGVIPKDFPRARAAAVNASPVVVGAHTKGEFVETEQGVKDAVAQMMEEFDSVFSEGGHLQPMKGESMTIHIQKDIYIKPLRICTPRKTPYAYQNAAKAKLDEDEANGIIEKVEGVSDWCSAMLFVPKPGGKVCSVLDLVHLNRYVQIPTHPFPAPKDILARIPTDSVCYAVFDAKNGYWQVPLDDESKPYTTFITEWGRYRYKRAPMGLVSSGDEFCARTDRALSGVTTTLSSKRSQRWSQTQR
jgi:hypothetical protein